MSSSTRDVDAVLSLFHLEEEQDEEMVESSFPMEDEMMQDSISEDEVNNEEDLKEVEEEKEPSSPEFVSNDEEFEREFSEDEMEYSESEDDVIFVKTVAGKKEPEAKLESVRVRHSGGDKGCFLRFYFKYVSIFNHSHSAVDYFVPCDQNLQTFIYYQLLKNKYLKESGEELPVIDWNLENFEITSTFLYPKRMVSLCGHCYDEYKKGVSLKTFDELLRTHVDRYRTERVNKKNIRTKREESELIHPPHDLVDRLIFNKVRLKRILEHHWTLPKHVVTERTTQTLRLVSYIERLYKLYKHLILQMEFTKAETVSNALQLTVSTHGQYLGKASRNHHPVMWMDREEILITHTKLALANAFIRGGIHMLQKMQTWYKSGERVYMYTKLFSNQIHIPSTLQVAFFFYRYIKKDTALKILNRHSLSWVASSITHGYADIITASMNRMHGRFDLDVLEKLVFRLPGFSHNHDFLDFLCECAYITSKTELICDFYARFYEHAPNDIFAMM